MADGELRRQTLARLRDTGIRVLDVEILRLKPETVVADFEKILAVGAEFGASELLVAGNDPDEQRLTENFAGLCDLAAALRAAPASGVHALDRCAQSSTSRAHRRKRRA